MKDEEGPGAPVGSIPGRDPVWGQEEWGWQPSRGWGAMRRGRTWQP